MRRHEQGVLLVVQSLHFLHYGVHYRCKSLLKLKVTVLDVLGLRVRLHHSLGDLLDVDWAQVLFNHQQNGGVVLQHIQPLLVEWNWLFILYLLAIFHISNLLLEYLPVIGDQQLCILEMLLAVLDLCSQLPYILVCNLELLAPLVSELQQCQVTILKRPILCTPSIVHLVMNFHLATLFEVWKFVELVEKRPWRVHIPLAILYFLHCNQWFLGLTISGFGCRFDIFVWHITLSLLRLVLLVHL